MADINQVITLGIGTPAGIKEFLTFVAQDRKSGRFGIEVPYENRNIQMPAENRGIEIS